MNASSVAATATSTVAYHRQELAIALSPDDRRRLQPNLPERFKTILDIGCGAGQTLVACGFGDGVDAWGVDLDTDALALGHELAPGVRFVCSPGEQLPFRDGSFDVVISRVALPYMHIPCVLDEVARVLKPGGHFWFALPRWTFYSARLKASVKSGNVKDVLYSTYVFANGLLFHCTGRQVRFPLNRRRCESYQTLSGMSRALRARGFDIANSTLEPFFEITAVKSSARRTP